MRFDLIPKHRAKLANVSVEALKMGQTELKPAITLRFKLTAGTSLGSLERSTPSRPTFAPCSPTWVTHPVTTSPMRPGSMPVRSKRASRTLA